MALTRRAFLRRTVGACGAAALAGLSGRRGWAAPPRKPNILLILADDMGYSDIGCYGGEILTPNLDELAANGIRFTQFYNTARCCPTRASLMTGLYPHEAGVGHLSGRNMGPGYMGYLNLECVTLPELLNEE